MSDSTLSDARPHPRKIWRVGTLSYTPRGLFNVFGWMLWGDFCLNLMDSGVAPNLALIQLRKMGASSFTISILTVALVEVLAIVFVPIISTWSDRHRSAMGRRMPFMLWATPPLALCLGILGFAPNL